MDEQTQKTTLCTRNSNLYNFLQFQKRENSKWIKFKKKLNFWEKTATKHTNFVIQNRSWYVGPMNRKKNPSLATNRHCVETKQATFGKTIYKEKNISKINILFFFLLFFLMWKAFD